MVEQTGMKSTPVTKFLKKLARESILYRSGIRYHP